MSGTFDNSRVELPCPKCGHKHAKTISWLKANRRLACESCRESITIDNSNFASGLKKADKSFEDFRRRIRNIGR